MPIKIEIIVCLDKRTIEKKRRPPKSKSPKTVPEYEVRFCKEKQGGQAVQLSTKETDYKRRFLIIRKRKDPVFLQRFCILKIISFPS